MSVREYEECELCGSYHCKFYVCSPCLIGYAVKAGANKERFVEILNKRLKSVRPPEYPHIYQIDDFDLEQAQFIIG